MGDRPNAKPLASNEDDTGDDDSTGSEIQNAINASVGGTPAPTVKEKDTPSVSSLSKASQEGSGGGGVSTGLKRIAANGAGPNMKHPKGGASAADAAIVSFLEGSDLESLCERERLKHGRRKQMHA